MVSSGLESARHTWRLVHINIKEVLRTAIQDWIVPELDKIRLEHAEIRSTLQLTNKQLDDIQAQLIDQSRRIDETNQRMDETNRGIDHTHARLDRLYEVIVRCEEHWRLEGRVAHLEQIVDNLRQRAAA